MIIVSEHTNITFGSKVYTADFDKMEAFVELDPCQEYKIYLRIRISNGRYIESDIVRYNDISRQNIKSLYGGLLKDKSFVEEFALSRKN